MHTTITFENVSSDFIKDFKKANDIVFRYDTIEFVEKEVARRNYTGVKSDDTPVLVVSMFTNVYDSVYFTVANLLRKGDTLQFNFHKGYHDNQYTKDAGLVSESIIAVIKRNDKKMFFEVDSHIIKQGNNLNTYFRN